MPRLERLDFGAGCDALNRAHAVPFEPQFGSTFSVADARRSFPCLTSLSASTSDDELQFTLDTLAKQFAQMDDLTLRLGHYAFAPDELLITLEDIIRATLGSFHRLANLHRLTLHIDAEWLSDRVLEQWSHGLTSLSELAIVMGVEKRQVSRLTRGGLAHLLRLPKLHALRLDPRRCVKLDESSAFRRVIQQANDAGRHPPLELVMSEDKSWRVLTRLTE